MRVQSHTERLREVITLFNIFLQPSEHRVESVGECVETGFVRLVGEAILFETGTSRENTTLLDRDKVLIKYLVNEVLFLHEIFDLRYLL